MANGYISLNSKKYSIAWGTYQEPQQVSRTVQIGLSGKTLIDQFAYTDYTWKMDIIVRVTESRSGYGTYANLKTAYALSYVAFVDPWGTSCDVIMEGELPAALGPSLSLATYPFNVSLALKKRQT